MSVPGWVVEALRRHRDEGWPIPEPHTKRRGMTDHGPIDVAAYTSGAYGDLFRLGSDTSDLDATALDREEMTLAAPARLDAQTDRATSMSGAHGDRFRLGSDLSVLDATLGGLEALDLGAPVQPDGAIAMHNMSEELSRLGSNIRGLDESACALEPDAPAHSDAGALGQPRQALFAPPERHTDSPGATVDPNRSADPSCDTAMTSLATATDVHRIADPSHATATDAALTQQLHADLLVQCGRRYRPVIAGLEIHIAGSATVIVCGSVGDMAVVQNELLGAIHGILARLGAPMQFVCTTRAAWQARHGSAGNARSRPDSMQRVLSTA